MLVLIEQRLCRFYLFSVFQQDIINVAMDLNNYKKATPLVDPWCKTLLLVSVRMGADELNMTYKDAIQVSIVCLPLPLLLSLSVSLHELLCK